MPPEAWGTLGYILGGLLLILLSRRGDIEKIADKSVQRAVDKVLGAPKPVWGASPVPVPALASANALPAIDDTNPRLVLLLLEKLTHDLEAHERWTRSEFDAIRAEFGLHKRSDP